MLTETVTLTLSRAGGAQRRLARFSLAPNERAVVAGVPMGSGDTLYGQTTDAATVDYVVSRSSSDLLVSAAFDAQGSPKSKSLAGIGVATNNLTAAADPGASNDNTQGYAAGSVWINSTASRVWMCLSAATGAAVWLLDGVVPGVGVEPSSMLTYFGGGTATFLEEGNVNRQISAAGVNPGATGADNVLAVYSLPANSFDQALRGLTITAAGSFGATGNSKRVKLLFNPATAVVGSTVGAGGTLLADTGTVTTNGGGWLVSGNVFKYGGSGSNTQLCTSNGAISGGSHNGVSAPALATATESGAVLIAVTGNAGTVVSDIAFNWLEVNAMN